MKSKRWIGLLALGVTACVAGGVWLLLMFWSTFASDDHEVPGSFTVELEAEDFVIFEQVAGGTRIGNANFTTTRAPVVTNVSVVDANGRDLPVTATFGSQTLTINERSYIGIASFEVEAAGPHTVTVESTSPSVVRIGRDLFSSFLAGLAPVGLLLLGVAMSLSSIVMLIVTRSRRRHAENYARYIDHASSMPPAPAVANPPPPTDSLVAPQPRDRWG